MSINRDSVFRPVHHYLVDVLLTMRQRKSLVARDLAVAGETDCPCCGREASEGAASDLATESLIEFVPLFESEQMSWWRWRWRGKGEVMFTNEDRTIIREINQSIGQINDRLDIHGQLVEMNATLKEIRKRLGGMTPEQEADLKNKLGETLGNLKEIGK